MPSCWGVVHQPGATRVSSASSERRSAETLDWARKTRASMGVRGWQDRDEIWVVGLDAARETTMRYNWKLDEFVATILISDINVKTLGTRLRISLSGTWKVRTRSGPCDAKTTREQTVWSALSTAAIKRGGRSYREVGLAQFEAQAVVQSVRWCQRGRRIFSRVWTGSIARSRRRNETVPTECVSISSACVESMIDVSVEV